MEDNNKRNIVTVGAINKPGIFNSRGKDNAYFLVIGVCVAAYLVVVGGVITFVAYFWHMEPSYKHDSSYKAAHSTSTKVIGPLFLVVGIILFISIALIGYFCGCETRKRFYFTFGGKSMGKPLVLNEVQPDYGISMEEIQTTNTPPV